MTSATEITFSVIWLHGIGQDPEDVRAVAHRLAPPEAGVRGVFPRAPATVLSPLTGRAASTWFIMNLHTLQADQPSLVAAERRLRPLIDAEVERFGAQRVALAGFSQGGVMALYSGLRYRLPLAGIAVYAAFPLNNVGISDSLSLSTSKVPIWMGHGADDWVIPYDNGEELKQLLTDRGHPVAWHRYQGGHETFGGVCSELAEFFQACKRCIPAHRDPSPLSISGLTRALSRRDRRVNRTEVGERAVDRPHRSRRARQRQLLGRRLVLPTRPPSWRRQVPVRPARKRADREADGSDVRCDRRPQLREVWFSRQVRIGARNGDEVTHRGNEPAHRVDRVRPVCVAIREDMDAGQGTLCR